MRVCAGAHKNARQLDMWHMLCVCARMRAQKCKTIGYVAYATL